MILDSEMEPYGKPGGVTLEPLHRLQSGMFPVKGKCVKLSLSHSLTAPDVHVKKRMQKMCSL